VDPECRLSRLENLSGNEVVELMNQHVVAVERRIRVFKSRNNEHTTTYWLCKKLLESLIYHVTTRINMEPSSLNSYGPSLWETCGGRKADYSVIIKASFVK